MTEGWGGAESGSTFIVQSDLEGSTEVCFQPLGEDLRHLHLLTPTVGVPFLEAKRGGEWFSGTSALPYAITGSSLFLINAFYVEITSLYKLSVRFGEQENE